MRRSPLARVFDAQKKQHKTEWLNTPNSYKREEVEETGTTKPKKITKWVSESGSTGSTPVKVENPNQFAPQGVNPKEYKEKFQAIRKEYYTEKIDAGPQSRILEGPSWEEAERLKVTQHDQMLTCACHVICMCVVGVCRRSTATQWW